MTRLCPARSDANSPDAQASGLLIAHTWFPCIEVRPSGFYACPYVLSANPTVCVETFIFSWYNHPKRYKETTVSWQIAKARKDS